MSKIQFLCQIRFPSLFWQIADFVVILSVIVRKMSGSGGKYTTIRKIQNLTTLVQLLSKTKH